MLDPNEWGDEVVLNIASNLLEVDIKIIPAFQESSCNEGFTIIKPLNDAKHDPLFLFVFSESDFKTAHYESVYPKTENDVILTSVTSRSLLQTTILRSKNSNI